MTPERVALGAESYRATRVENPGKRDLRCARSHGLFEHHERAACDSGFRPTGICRRTEAAFRHLLTRVPNVIHRADLWSLRR